MRKAGLSVKELSRRAKISYYATLRIVNLQFRPTQERADAIQKVLGECGVFLDVLENWPETFKGFEKPARVEVEREVSEERLLELASPILIPEHVIAPDEGLMADEDGDPLVNIVSQLRKPYSKILELKASGKSSSEIGKEMGLKPASVRSMTASAIRMARRHLFNPTPTPPKVNVAEVQAKMERQKLQKAESALRREKYKALLDQRKAEALKAFE